MHRITLVFISIVFLHFGHAVNAQTKNEVFEVQQMLNALGFDAGEADGLYGKKTNTALVLFFNTIGQKYDNELDSTDITTLKEVFDARLENFTKKPEVVSTEIYLNEHHSPDLEAALTSLAEIKKYGMNTLTVSFYCGITPEFVATQTQWHERKKKRILNGLVEDCYLPKISTFWVPNAALYDGDALTVYSKYAVDLGLKVHVKPMYLEHTPTYGLQKMPMNVFWDGNKKFSGFKKSIINVARMAKSVGAEALIVGTELTNLNENILKSNNWNSVLSKVKDNFGGKLYYAHNLGPKGSIKSANEINLFAQHLDYIGINYFPPNLMDGQQAYTQNELVQAIETARVDNSLMMQVVQKLSEKSMKKIILTESHFPSWKGAANWMFRGSCDYQNKNKRDWVFTKGPLAPKTPDLSEPVKLAKAWHATFQNKSFLAGYNYPFWIDMPYYGMQNLSTAERNNPDLLAKKKLKFENDFDCSGSIFHKKSGLKEYLRTYHGN